MIIELTGMPAVGKSTLIKKIEDRRPVCSIIYSDQLVLSSKNLHIRNSYFRRLVSDILLCLLFMRVAHIYKRHLSLCLKMLIPLHESWFVKMNLLRNLILKFAVFHFLHERYKKAVVIIDEGVSHIPFNLIDYTGNQTLDLWALFESLREITQHLVVVRLDRDPAAVKAHLRQRGHRRLNHRSRYTMEAFMDGNRRLSAAFASLPEGFFLRKLDLHLGTEDDARSFIHLLESELMK